jgi:hypothetical protein
LETQFQEITFECKTTLGTAAALCSTVQYPHNNVMQYNAVQCSIVHPTDAVNPTLGFRTSGFPEEHFDSKTLLQLKEIQMQNN